ncbi:NADPH-dependent F420 reductase [Thermoleophilum album]|uniref:NADPH-dependent F420 reductase n=1 Tax=Thermoleophilum album TaxID=29539 RepID=UPI00237CD0C2|nr:NADPH-dependent F420 reductase [Thermoleophilum album]WDT94315.1 NADPH-dependent F420 reductase [Thermoleophilum album]
MATVPIIGGTGALGFGLALRLAAAGEHVVVGSRDIGRANEAVSRLREVLPQASAEAAVNEEAATRGDVVLLCVPFRAQSENLTRLKPVLQPGQVLVDATVPLAAAFSGKATRLLGVPQGSAAEQAAEMVPDGVDVVSAFHTVSADRLRRLDEQLDEDVLIAGDRRAARRRVAELVLRIDGLRPVDCGPLEMARMIEGLTPLLISINRRYRTHAGVRITGLPEDAAGHWAD